MTNPTRDTNRLSDSFMFLPHAISDIHIKAELGRYRMRNFSLLNMNKLTSEKHLWHYANLKSNENKLVLQQ